MSSDGRAGADRPAGDPTRPAGDRGTEEPSPGGAPGHDLSVSPDPDDHSPGAPANDDRSATPDPDDQPADGATGDDRSATPDPDDQPADGATGDRPAGGNSAGGLTGNDRSGSPGPDDQSLDGATGDVRSIDPAPGGQPAVGPAGEDLSIGPAPGGRPGAGDDLRSAVLVAGGPATGADRPADGATSRPGRAVGTGNSPVSCRLRRAGIRPSEPVSSGGGYSGLLYSCESIQDSALGAGADGGRRSVTGIDVGMAWSPPGPS